MKELIIATRGSKLALWQSWHIQERIEKKHNIKVKIKIFKTKGDKILDTPLSLVGGKGLFTKELEDAMLRGDAHIAVHSLKDVPTVLPKGLVLAAVTKREDTRDALLSQEYASVYDLPLESVVGTTSLRRKMQLLYIRPDLRIKNLRGNIDTRIKKLKNGEYDAIILAMAGIKRLNLENEVKFVVPIDEDKMIPAMGQAALGIECINNKSVLDIISFLNDENSFIETTIERDFVEGLGGGCDVPIGVRAKVLEEGDIIIRAVVGLPNGKELLKEKIVTKKDAISKIGKQLADLMIKEGAKEILQKAHYMAIKEQQ